MHPLRWATDPSETLVRGAWSTCIYVSARVCGVWIGKMSESDDNEDALQWEGMPGMMASLQRSASLPETNDDHEVEFNDSHSVDSNDSHTQSLHAG